MTLAKPIDGMLHNDENFYLSHVNFITNYNIPNCLNNVTSVKNDIYTIAVQLAGDFSLAFPDNNQAGY